MLDEASNILIGLLSGEPVSFAGKYQRIENAQFLPKPIQQPRIPIWVGGNWPIKAPFRRTANWEGAFPLFSAWENEEELTQLDDMVCYENKHRKQEPPIDMIIMGVTPDADTEY